MQHLPLELGIFSVPRRIIPHKPWFRSRAARNGAEFDRWRIRDAVGLWLAAYGLKDAINTGGEKVKSGLLIERDYYDKKRGEDVKGLFVDASKRPTLNRDCNRHRQLHTARLIARFGPAMLIFTSMIASLKNRLSGKLRIGLLDPMIVSLNFPIIATIKPFDELDADVHT